VCTYNTINCYDFAENNTILDGLTKLAGGGGEITYLIRFFVLILGVRTPPPRIEAPVMNMPLPQQRDQPPNPTKLTAL
jgi:hypothetical protein